LLISIFLFLLQKAYISVGKPEPEGKSPLEDVGMDRRLILQWILGNQGGKV